MLNTFEHDEGIALLVRLVLNNALVPVIGAGFTMGSTAANGEVPGGEELRLLMKKCILQCGKKHTEDELNEMNFNDTADIFLDKNENKSAAWSDNP